MKMSIPRALRTTLLLMLFAAAMPIFVHAQSVFADDKGLAIKGYDPVAYFTDNKPMQGKVEFVHEWAGAKWNFASAEHRDAFKAAPEKYAPQYGGFCAFGVCMKNAKFPTDPTAWKVVEGKLYLNYNKQTQDAWAQDPLPATISKGDANWKTLSSATPPTTKK